MTTRLLAAGLLILMVACAAQLASAQKKLSEGEMKGVIKLQDFRYESGKRHECNYMEKPADSYSSGGTTDRYYLECCGGRKFPVCGGRNAEFQLRCCPGFVRFQDLDGSSKCNQRILSDREAFVWLNEFRAESVGLNSFVKSFINTEQVGTVLKPDQPNNLTWTILAVADSAFKPAALSGFRAISKCSSVDPDAESASAASSGGGASSGGTPGKVAEGSPKHRALIYLQKCKETEPSGGEAPGTVDFSNEAWKHVIPGRKYVSDMQKETSVLSMYKTASGLQYPLKFSRYSSGVACIECAPIVEANHEAANAVIHILGKSILSNSSAMTLGALVQSRFPNFWTLLAEPERRLLGSTGCGAFYTVLVPKDLTALNSLSGDQRTAAVREHIVKGLWCTAGMIDAETQPVATAAAESVKFACDGSSRRLVRFGKTFRGQATVSSTAGEFDVMATNGVVHVIDRAIIPSEASTLMFALQADSAELFEEKATENLAIGLIRECSVKFQSDKGYIVLLPTDAAFRKFFTRRGIPEAVNFRDNADVRCSLLRHHILETDRDLTSLGRATHLQKTYRTLSGDRVADFLFVKNGALKVFFMNAEVVHGADGHEFLNGHIYHTNDVLIPPSSEIWWKMINDLYGDQRRVISRFRALVSSSSDRLATLFLPKTGYNSLINLETLKSHTADTVFYLNYLSGEIESIDLLSYSGGKISIVREAGQYFVSSGGASTKKVLLRDCGVKVSVGVICSIEEPLGQAPALY